MQELIELKWEQIGMARNAAGVERGLLNDGWIPAGHASDASAAGIAGADQLIGPTNALTQTHTLQRLRAFETLCARPATLAGLSKDERDCIVVTAVADDNGNEYPVSRVGDHVWDLSAEMEAVNRRSTLFRITWPDDLPPLLVSDAKAALYCAWRRGRDNCRPWTCSAVIAVARSGIPALRHLACLGVQNFAEVRALYLADYISTLRKRCKPDSAIKCLAIVDLVWSFPNDMLHPLPEHPWAGVSLHEACGCNEADDGPSGKTGRTPVIPLSVQRTLFAHCEAWLKEAHNLLDDRDDGRITPYSYALTAVRDAVLYLLQATSGMRNSESTGVTNGCWRIEQRNGISFHWVRTREVKTRQGMVDYLVPPETLASLEILVRYAQPLQARLADEAAWLKDLLSGGNPERGRLANGMPFVKAVQRLNYVREIGRHLFLCLDNKHSDHLATGSRVDVMSSAACCVQLRTLAAAAGARWKLTNHQCRRTFAFNVANSRLGRMGLIFLMWQLKHASMSLTQLYASNPDQDHALYRDMEQELVEARMDLMEGWMQPDVPLSGGAGKKLMQSRAIPVQDLREMLQHTAEAVTIRSTGHAWCLSGTEGCQGKGVYDPAMCASCSQAVIDREQATAWQMIHLENLQLAAIMDCGPAVAQKADRAIKRSAQVLEDLGVLVPTQEQARQYHARAGDVR